MALTHNTPSATAPTGSLVAPQQRIVQIALTQARPVVERVIETTRMSLQARLDSARTPGEHHAMQEARQQLVRLASVMAERYPDALRKALDEDTAQGDDKPTRSLFTVNFDDLELMDEAQINDSVERARARQVIVTAVEGPLADLDALVCTAQGLPRVQPEHNPLRPDVFLQALQSVVSQMQVTPQVRHDWMGLMAQALGTELRSLYLAQIDQLKQSGVKPAGYAMRQATGEVVYVAPAEAGVSPGFAADNDLYVASTSAGDPLLTLDRLRRLLLGEFNDAAAPAETHAPANDSQESFADRFAREFEDPEQGLPHIDPPATDFAMTVPAAFEALQEMNQVGQMMERLGTPRTPAAPGADGDPAAAQRAQVQGLGQALSMEVVALMVDNIARDTRLLWPVQQFIRALEPALMQLALSDPRFFSHKEHAARRLLQDITDRSQAFNSPEAPGFQSFMRSLMHIAGPLATATIESADDFEQVLQQLHAKWAEKDQALRQERQRAIEALQHAEQRHLLAAQISRELWLLPSMGKVPDAISRFLLGPWAPGHGRGPPLSQTRHHRPGPLSGAGGCADLERATRADARQHRPARPPAAQTAAQIARGPGIHRLPCRPHRGCLRVADAAAPAGLHPRAQGRGASPCCNGHCSTDDVARCRASTTHPSRRRRSLGSTLRGAGVRLHRYRAIPRERMRRHCTRGNTQQRCAIAAARVHHHRGHMGQPAGGGPVGAHTAILDRLAWQSVPFH